MNRARGAAAFLVMMLTVAASPEPAPDLAVFTATVTNLLTSPDVFSLPAREVQERLAPLGPMERTYGYSCGAFDLSIPKPPGASAAPFLVSVSIGTSSTCGAGLTLQTINLVLPGRHDELAAEAADAFTKRYGAPRMPPRTDGAVLRKWMVGSSGNITMLSGATTPPAVSILAANLAE